MEIPGERKYCIVIKDVTEFKQAGKELRDKINKLEKKNG